MKKVLKFSAWAAGGLAVIVALALAAAWVLGGMKISERFDAPDVDIAHSTDPAAIASGERLATYMGCNGCHRSHLEGGVLAELPDGTRLIAPNLPALAATYSDSDLGKAILYGVKKNGDPVLGMPSDAFYNMTDAHLVDILSYIRATPDPGDDLGETFYGPLVRFFLAKGDYKTAPAVIKTLGARRQFDFTDPVSRGEYLARMTCAECHGHDFNGSGNAAELGAPDLVIAAAYTLEDFSTLMKTGVAAGGREVGLMSEVGRGRFAAFTNEEIEDLHAFLRARAAAQQ